MNTNTTLHFTECGLDNVYLVNGFRYAQIGGQEVLVIEDLAGLHRAIAMTIVDAAAPLDAQTFRFLRKHLDMAQHQLADLLGLSKEIVSLWERARQPVPKTADLILRAMVKEQCSGNAELIRIIERYNALDRDANEQAFRLRLDQHTWRAAA